MSIQIINDPNRYGGFEGFARSVGQGLSEQLPKEIERRRLAAGLKRLEQQKDLDPMQFFTQAATLPGATPQLIESLATLAKQRMKSQAAKSFASDPRDEERKHFPTSPFQGQEGQGGEAIPSITTRDPIDETLDPYIPKDSRQIAKEAEQAYNQNPAFFEYDFNKAIDYMTNEDQRQQAISETIQGKRTKEQNVQNTVVESLRNQFTRLGANVPSNVYSAVEDEAVNAVRSKKDGGRGLTEFQAAKEYGDKLDKISRDYAAVDALGEWSFATNKAKKNKAAILNLQKDFAKRNDLENFAGHLMSKTKISPTLAYNLAYPTSQEPELNKELSRLKKMDRRSVVGGALTGGIKGALTQGVLGMIESPKIRKATEAIIPKLAESLGNGSPLSVAYELENKGYDSSMWLAYLSKHRERLGLTERQGRELKVSPSGFPNLNDAWLTTFSDMDTIKEAP